MKAIILVGGEGTRLRPLTLGCLKAIVPMAGCTFLEYQFALLKKHGVRDITLSICHMPGLIKRALGDGRRYGVKLHYAIEQQPLGTAGAIKNAEPLVVGKEPVVVMNGDVLSSMDLTKMFAVHRRHQACLTIALTWVEDPSAYGLVQLNSRRRVLRFLEKPNGDECQSHWINAGFYIFNPAVFARIPAGINYSAERALFPGLLSSGQRVWAFPSRDYWKDIGTPAKYHQANMDILEGQMFQIPSGRVWKGQAKIRVGKSCKIHPTATLNAPAVLGDDCEVGAESQIVEANVLGHRVKVGSRVKLERSVVWEGVQIGEGAKLVGCVVGANSRIGRLAVVREGSVLGDHTVIPAFSVV